MFSATFRFSDHRMAEPITGPIDKIADYFARIDWMDASEDQSGDLPALEIRRSTDPDLLLVEFDRATGTFQCSTYIAIPGKFLGMPLWLLNDGWESDSVLLPPQRVHDALAAFDAKDVEELKAIWATA